MIIEYSHLKLSKSKYMYPENENLIECFCLIRIGVLSCLILSDQFLFSLLFLKKIAVTAAFILYSLSRLLVYFWYIIELQDTNSTHYEATGLREPNNFILVNSLLLLLKVTYFRTIFGCLHLNQKTNENISVFLP